MVLDAANSEKLIDSFLVQKEVVKQIQEQLLTDILNNTEDSDLQSRFAAEFDKYMKLWQKLAELKKDNPDAISDDIKAY